MTVAIIGTVVLAIVVFAFVLDPVLRARADRVVLDEVAVPQPVRLPLTDEDVVLTEENDPDGPVIADRPLRRPVPMDRPLGGDLT